MRLAGMTAVVTGGESGIGAAIVARFHAEGGTVVSADLSVDHDGLRETGERSFAARVDVSDEESVRALFVEAADRVGGIDVAVNSAGIGHDVPFLETPVALFDKIMAVNLRGTFLVGQAAGRHMVARGRGSIVNVASVAGLRGSTGRSAYGASKAGVILMSQVMAVDMGGTGVRVNVIAPGPVDTPLVERMHGPEIRQRWLEAMPMHRYGTPDEIAAAAVFLASDDSSFVNGHVLAVDGGFAAAGIMPARA
jgi:NAD(P)-dependent dehydrogenase (short-subunit alcohol dehydrogenase family)